MHLLCAVCLGYVRQHQINSFGCVVVVSGIVFDLYSMGWIDHLARFSIFDRLLSIRYIFRSILFLLQRNMTKKFFFLNLSSGLAPKILKKTFPPGAGFKNVLYIFL